MVVTRQDEGDVAVLVYDVSGDRMNTLGEAGIAELDAAVREVAADGRVVGAVLASGKPDNFCAGADIRRLPEAIALAERGEALGPVAAMQSLVRTMMDLPKPLVAAVHGPALGGGLELALACHSRVATSADVTQFGLPEVKLGLLPGAGGTQNLPRRIPVPVALEYLLTGRTMYGTRARALGLVDDVVPVNQLRRAAVARVLDLAAGRHAPPAVPPVPQGRELAELMSAARTLSAQQSKGLWPAPGVILDVVEVGLTEGLDAGFAAEREGFVRLLATPEARAGIHLFLASDAARRRARDGRDVRRVFVLGGGMMGAGLGAQIVDSGMDARVRDLSQEALVRVRRYTDRVLRDRYGKRGERFPYLYRERVHRLSTTTGLDGIGLADVVVEAVFEDRALKHRVIREAEARMRPDAVLASNTSAIPITALAEASARPDRFIGMHFFSPVEKMPLVEVITHPGTSQETLATTLALALRLNKVPIVVADSPGFYTSRVFGRWLAEGARLLMEGARIEQIDGAAKALGFPVGPLTAYDEVSLDLAAKAGADPVTAAVTADRVDPAPVRTVVGSLVDAGRLGRKAGKGFYAYDADDRRTGPAEEVYGITGAPGTGDVDEAELRDRLVWSFVSEALLCWDEGLLGSPADGDVGAVLGIGFPANLGGPFLHTDLVGVASAVATLERLGAPAFTASTTLRKLAESGGRFADL